ncbi:MAG: hypothetical protein ACYS80_18755, partial [Planctomycetota bacterium]
MNFNKKYVLLFICLAAITILLSCTVQHTSPPIENSPTVESNRSSDNKELAQKILNNPDLTFVLEKAKSILKKGLTAGS